MLLLDAWLHLNHGTRHVSVIGSATNSFAIVHVLNYDENNT